MRRFDYSFLKNLKAPSSSFEEVASLLPDISITTIEKVIAPLVKEGKVMKIGDKSNAKYRSNKK